jgi:hypothetical protein
MYFTTFATDAEKRQKASEITPYMSETLAYYLDYNLDLFEIFIGDIASTTLFKECLSANTGLFETSLPAIVDKLNTKYNV